MATQFEEKKVKDLKDGAIVRFGRRSSYACYKLITKIGKGGKAVFESVVSNKTRFSGQNVKVYV